MVLVTWNRETDELLDIEPATGPGDNTDDIDIDRFADRLSTIRGISEKEISNTMMAVYEGRFSDQRCRIVAETFTDGNNGTPNEAVSTIAFIELSGEEGKFSILTCEECGFDPEHANGWDFREREASGWTYHDWICPKCSSIVHTELADTGAEGLQDASVCDSEARFRG
jgi:hypothetical protein